jgi:hypothetical protein
MLRSGACSAVDEVGRAWRALFEGDMVMVNAGADALACRPCCKDDVVKMIAVRTSCTGVASVARQH